MKILYVEDDHALRTQYAEFLSRRAEKVYEAANGQEGLDLFAEHQPDIVITDLRMPVMDGIQMIKHIRDVKPKQKIMITTAYSDVDYMLGAIDLNVNKYILKPIQGSSLSALLEEVTEQIILEKDREIYQQYIETIINTEPSMVILNTGTELLIANRAFLEFVQCESVQEFKQKHQCICELFHDEPKYKQMNQKEWLQEIEQLSKNYEVAEVKLKNEYFSLQVNKMEEKGEYIVTLSNITLQKRFEQQLIQQVEDEIAKNEKQHQLLMNQSRHLVMSDMLRSIAHHWRQPLSVLLLQIETIKDYFEHEVDRETTETLLHKSSEQIMKLSKTIEQFRKFYKQSDNQETFNAHVAIKRTIDFATPLLEDKHIKVNLHNDETVTIHNYKNELKQILLGLINNSIEAISEKQQKDSDFRGEITIQSYASENDQITIVLSDTGGGIDNKNMGKLFEPYFSTKEALNGTGLGLFMCKSLIERYMNGTIEANNTPQGLSITLTFARNSDQIQHRSIIS